MTRSRRIDEWTHAPRAAISIPYMAVLLLGPFADAVIDATAMHQNSHIEAESTVRCGVAHDEYMCQLCRLVELSACAPTRQSFALTPGALHRLGVTEAGWTVIRVARLSHNPRAPPSSPILVA